MTLQELNMAAGALASESLKRCCGSQVWVRQLTEQRPFSSKEALFAASDQIWNALSPRDWLEAFAQHPKIGQNSTAKWSSEEQKGMLQTSTETAAAIQQLNSQYERKFGWIFIVCATGKTADEMLAMLAARLNNDSTIELVIAAAEQAEITKLRLEKLLAE